MTFRTVNRNRRRNAEYMKQRTNPKAFLIAVLIGIVIISLFAVAFGQREIVSAQTDVILTVHEDSSITLKDINGNEIKGFANVNALAGPNGLTDLIEQMELWN